MFHMNKCYFHRIVSILVLFVLVFSITGCAMKVQSANLMDGLKAETVSKKTMDKKFITQTANFSVDLFKKSMKENENSLISPLSVLLALAMTANGADSITKEEMELLLAGGSSIDELNEYLYSYVNQLPSEKNSKLNIANSIWFRDDENNFTVKQDFLQKNANFYDAAAYKSPFDNTTIKDINLWVKNNTDGMIKEIIDKIDKDTIMYLINAVVFDARWENVYVKNDISSEEFTAWNGTKRKVKMMKSNERLYIDDGNATGFIKKYQNDQYSFVALLPNIEVSIEDYISSLTGEHFVSIIKNAQMTGVTAQLPKFKFDYSIEMNDALKDLGLLTSFDIKRANFSNLGSSPDGNIYIAEVLHKAYIDVDELGTKAGAVSKVGMKTKSAPFEFTVKLDRPFLFAIVDNKTNLPIFIGTVMNIE
ncbi:serpin family protein [Lachnoclostridium phytofermentans]|uniref:Proteinase inhibitor I4 serpin n=1 Tax=Lachnoclostridium phytofermentans (strain ATCC 700394 / DSM 18823 / ISDg) TaxID=357809 RepID=A9KID0_LACP7|nr:serpin family protein [Lachnoclostridium phytofermentans]ABX42382.1 proteinase inhibitor I4 serpin [Lachnoclostridium phytofermentans ISDg]